MKTKLQTKIIINIYKPRIYYIILIIKSTTNQPRTNHRPTTNQSQTNHEPITNQSRTNHKPITNPITNQPQTNHRPTTKQLLTINCCKIIYQQSKQDSLIFNPKKIIIAVRALIILFSYSYIIIFDIF